MDNFLSMLGDQVMKCAIRSGIALTSTLAINQSYRLLDLTSDDEIRSKYRELQEQFDSKVKIISPAIDLVEFKSIHGNVFLEAAAPLARSLHEDVVVLAKRIKNAAESTQPKTHTRWHLKKNNTVISNIIEDMEKLICRMDREIPLLQLAISASGESFSNSIPPSVSPSRLLQASTFLTMGDTQFASKPTHRAQIGPQFVLSVYMLFTAHTVSPRNHDTAYQEPNFKIPIWQEAIHKSTVRIFRKTKAPHSTKIPDDSDVLLGSTTLEYSYELDMVEDLNDERVHSDEHTTDSDGQHHVGIHETIPIRQITRLFYTNSGKILNLGDGPGGDLPVLLLKREVECQLETNSENVEKEETEKAGLPAHFDPEWIAFQVWEGDYDSDNSSTEAESDGDATSDEEDAALKCTVDICEPKPEDNIEPQLNDLSLTSEKIAPGSLEANDLTARNKDQSLSHVVERSPCHAITMSLSLIEMMIRLAGLQESQQMSHLSIPDHILTHFLDQLSSTEVQGSSNSTSREQIRQRIGFDPVSELSNQTA